MGRHPKPLDNVLLLPLLLLLLLLLPLLLLLLLLALSPSTLTAWKKPRASWPEQV
jgi:uncharacterized BrkB/YihY/UPF0761 family membrane protein